VRKLPILIKIPCWFFLVTLAVPQLWAQGVEVSAKILVRTLSVPTERKNHGSPSVGNVVIWLSPLKSITTPSPLPVRQSGFRLVQKHKMFTPHLLVVPTGASVQFPNQDPFFHNVFSLFNGKRFDLGLYESGATRSVRFDREGVSYIFCNIHPEMGAVILALSTPYYGISGGDGTVTIHNVPPGSYRLNVWSENGQPADQTTDDRIIQVTSVPLHLGDVKLQATVDALEHHKNKFGEEYKPNQEIRY
jgi:plastocyanin